MMSPPKRTLRRAAREKESKHLLSAHNVQLHHAVSSLFLFLLALESPAIVEHSTYGFPAVRVQYKVLYLFQGRQFSSGDVLKTCLPYLELHTWFKFHKGRKGADDIVPTLEIASLLDLASPSPVIPLN